MSEGWRFRVPEVLDLRAGRPREVFLRIMRRTRLCSDTGCLIWLGPTSGENGRGSGYARMSLDGHTVAVHRITFALFQGPIPGKKHVDHRCRNRLCVNWHHLEMTTHRENCRRRDAARKEETDED